MTESKESSSDRMVIADQCKPLRFDWRSRLVAAGSGGKGWGSRRLVAGAGGIEEVEEPADHPIACCHAKNEGAEDGEQEQGRYQECHHALLNAMLRCFRPDVSSSTHYCVLL